MRDAPPVIRITLTSRPSASRASVRLRRYASVKLSPSSSAIGVESTFSISASVQDMSTVVGGMVQYSLTEDSHGTMESVCPRRRRVKYISFTLRASISQRERHCGYFSSRSFTAVSQQRRRLSRSNSCSISPPPSEVSPKSCTGRRCSVSSATNVKSVVDEPASIISVGLPSSSLDMRSSPDSRE